MLWGATPAVEVTQSKETYLSAGSSAAVLMMAVVDEDDGGSTSAIT